MPWFIIHLMLHFTVPVVLAKFAFPDKWKSISLVMVSTMLVDLDHFLANPVFDPLRCSIGFHPLHSYYAIAVYLLMFVVPQLRFVALGLLIHMGLDGLECLRLALIR
ncbi:MAG: DUF6122 family protein [Smithella sp.]|nr:DUF6122 family protein [Smithella sp.]